jgi:heptosyltransferase-2/heptosyltransferase-3
VSVFSQTQGNSKSPRILVLRAGAIGDTLMVTPLVRALRHAFPNAFLLFVCSRSARDVVRYNPHLDQIIPLAYRHLPVWLSAEKWRALRALRDSRLDWGLVLESHPRFLDMARRAGMGRWTAYGALPGDDGFEPAAFDPHRHAIENHLRAALPLGVQPAGLGMELHYPAEFDQLVERRLAEAGVSRADRLVGIHAGWGGRKHSLDQTRLRSWPPDRFAQVARSLVQAAGSRVVLTGSPQDRALTRYIARLSGVPCLDLAARLPLLELAALIRRLDVYVTADSGPAHMAAALGTPLVTLWGPAIFEQTAPVGASGPVRVLYHRVPCAPCYGTPLMKTCQDNVCMKQIGTEEVLDAALKMLRLSEARHREPIPAPSGPRPPA